jgi:calcium-dependent protein kinase
MGIRVSEKTLKAKEFDLGYPRGFHDEFAIGHRLGKGGSGTVTHATRRSDGAEFAIKAIPKILRDPAASERKRALQIPSIQREVEVLLALRGTLNIATLEAVYEDDKDVFLVLELCRGGELLHGKGGHGREVLTERRVASYMRAILQTVAQCHARNILHRDIKPENFMHASTDPTAPIKAIDFGLAAFCPLNSLPLTAPNVEGTPWYLAPEACRGKWWPATDVWACGIMAAYMLTGYYPFIDRITPNMPDLARTL